MEELRQKHPAFKPLSREMVPLKDVRIDEVYSLEFEGMEQRNGVYKLYAMQVTETVPLYNFFHEDSDTYILVHPHRDYPSYGSFLGAGRKVAVYKATTYPKKQKKATPRGCQILLKLVKPGQRYFLQFHGECGALREWAYDGEYTFVAMNKTAGGYQFHGDKQFNEDNLVFDSERRGTAYIEGKQVQCSVHEVPDAKLREDRCCNIVRFEDAVVGEDYVLKFGGDNNARYDGKYTLESISKGSWHDVFYKFSGSRHFNRDNVVGCTPSCEHVGVAYILNKPAPVSLYESPETEQKKRDAEAADVGEIVVPDLQVGAKCKMTFTCPQSPPSQETTVNQAYAGEYVLLTIRAKAGLPRVFKFVSLCGAEDTLLLNREEQTYFTRFGDIFAYCHLEVL